MTPKVWYDNTCGPILLLQFNFYQNLSLQALSPLYIPSFLRVSVITSVASCLASAELMADVIVGPLVDKLTEYLVGTAEAEATLLYDLRDQVTSLRDQLEWIRLDHLCVSVEIYLNWYVLYSFYIL